jgi:hypothetical protein
MRNELRWTISDFVKALASANGSTNTRRKAAFAAAAYQDSEVLRSCFDDADQLWDSRRKSIIKTLDLGKNELRKEVERLGSIVPFNKYDPTTTHEWAVRLAGYRPNSIQYRNRPLCCYNLSGTSWNLINGHLINAERNQLVKY